ncbi:hydroxymethylbilane synthase [Sphingomonas sp. SM33]|uniref:Porphobilinogen deaminase n=1 Tax=Sphingomonas telluris TaxID=2907998 RepID=A0ABS9VPM7_9SPHN|nr:hydroxymethylbilane synthase [Sphingomonas telluris]MCH8616915.1 hydroxymethylbilane synthase [Sphingomonas telluris]
MERSPILGTRGSPLALAQAHKVASALEVGNRWPADFVQIQTVETSGDRIQDRPLAEFGGKQLWTKELDRALMEHEVDFCVHSLKDVEAIRPRDINIAAVRPRGDMLERLIGAESIDALKEGAVVGTSSPRRKAQLLSLRPDLKIVPIRGNVQTRLAKLQSGEVDATLLAGAGLRRLGINNVGTPIPLEVMLPAPTQAVIAIECRADDAVTQSFLTIVDDRTTHTLVSIERAFTAALGGSCHSPVAAYAEIVEGKVRFRAQLLSEDGRDQVFEDVTFECADLDTPTKLARAMLDRSPDSIRSLFTAG